MSKLIEKFRDQWDKLLNHEDTLAGQLYAVFMAFLVLVVCGIFVATTYPLDEELQDALILTEKGITVWFLCDYLLRWWVVRFSWKYPFTPFAIIDLISIFPLFFPQTHWQFVRILRLFRILRLLRVFRKRRFLIWTITEFNLRVTRILFTLFCLIFISAGTVFELEHLKNPYFGTFFDALYFSIVTLTTVGFGDMVPITTEGRAATLLMIISGVLLIPWQLMTLARFLVGEQHKAHKVCPKCSLSRHDVDANRCKICGTRLQEDE